LSCALNSEWPFVADIGLSLGSFERWHCFLFDYFCKNYCHPKSLYWVSGSIGSRFYVGSQKHCYFQILKLTFPMFSEEMDEPFASGFSID